MTQPQLFANPATPKPPPDTREIAKRRTGTKKRDILRALMRSLLDGPVSADAWAIERGYSVLAVRPRMTELFKAGLIYKVGTAESIDGNPQNVFQMGVIHVVRILDPSLHYRGPIGGYTVDAVIDETLTRAGL